MCCKLEKDLGQLERTQDAGMTIIKDKASVIGKHKGNGIVYLEE